MRDKSGVHVGMFMDGGGHPVEYGPVMRRDAIREGVFLHGGPVANTNLNTEIAVRLAAARQKLDAIAAMLQRP